jgi:hypothetical protein
MRVGPRSPADSPRSGRRWLRGALLTGAVALAAALPAGPARAATPTGATGGPGDVGAEVVLRALALLGVNYRWGGNTPETGLDCSGLVHLVYRDALGLILPRRSEEMSRAAGSVDTADLRPGDLVFFNTLRRAFSHVGIYIGDGQFIHAPSAGGAVRVERIDQSYWARRFDGARRVVAAAPPPDRTPPTVMVAAAAPAAGNAAVHPGPASRAATATRPAARAGTAARPARRTTAVAATDQAPAPRTVAFTPRGLADYARPIN